MGGLAGFQFALKVRDHSLSAPYHGSSFHVLTTNSFVNLYFNGDPVAAYTLGFLAFQSEFFAELEQEIPS
jgi:hypothetical protein